jgi:hypothetical protein
MNIQSLKNKASNFQIDPSAKNTLVILVAALGMMSGLLASEVKELGSWTEATNPKFIAAVMGHFSLVVGAYIAGRLTPENRKGKRTREYDEG